MIYTAKELSMHVDGPKGMVDMSVFREHAGHGVLTQQQAQTFVTQGYFIEQGLVRQDLLDSARRYVDGNYLQWLKKSRRQDDWRMHLMLDFDQLDQPVEHAPILDVLMQSPGVLRILHGLLGGRPQGMFYNQVAFRTCLPAPTAATMDYTAGAEYHIDGNCNHLGIRFPDPFTVLVGVALVDVPMNKGNFTVFPGAHARPWDTYPADKMAKALPSLGNPAMVCLAAGDAVFAHVLLPHRGGKNILQDLACCPLEGLQHILPGTREMVFFRIRSAACAASSHAPGDASPVLRDPWAEHQAVLDVLR